MIQSLGKYYLYRHIRLDTNEPFYIGIGTKKRWNTLASMYARAYSKKRNKFWHRTVSKTEYKVEILLESDDYSFIMQKEMEFISLYGRKDLGKGTLVNLTDGGEGSLGQIMSEEAIQKSVNNRIILKRGKNPAAKKVIDTLTLEVFDCATDASEYYGMKKDLFRSFLNGGKKNPTYCIYLEDYNGEIHYPEKVRVMNKKIINRETGEVYENCRDASEKLNVAYKCMNSYIRNPKHPFEYLPKE